MKTKGMVFRYTWVYSKEDTMAHTRRLVVTSLLLVGSAYETLYKVLMNINESGCRPYGMASALIVIGVSVWYPDNSHHAGHQEFSTCHTRSESHNNIYHVCLCQVQIRLPTLTLKPKGYITRSPKQEYQWPHERTCVQQFFLKKLNLARIKNRRSVNVFVGTPTTQMD